MTPVERLQAAIEKLEALRRERGYVEHNGWLAEEVPGDTLRYTFEDLSPVTNDELIVTLHRTIDAQLAILRHAISEYEPRDDTMTFITEDGLALADAILGSDS